MNTSYSQFSQEQLRNIDEADDLKISPLRSDGITYGTPTWILEVVVDGSLYVRAYNGTRSSWYQSAVKHKAEQIHAAGLVWDVNFETITGIIQQLIDEAYRYLQAVVQQAQGISVMRAEQLRQRIGQVPRTTLILGISHYF